MRDAPELGSSKSSARGGIRGRALRWIGGAVGALFVVIGLVIVAVWFIGSDLDRPWIKSRVLAFSRDALGFAIDYEGLAVSLRHGVVARSFRLFSPPSLESGAPEFVRVDDLEVRTSLWKVALGGRSIERLRVGSLNVSIVRDESGKTTLSELFPPQPDAAAEPSAALSHSLADLPRLSIGALEVGKIGGRFVELRSDGSRRMMALASLGVRGVVVSDSEQGLSGTAIEVVGAPLEIELSDRGAVQHATLGVDLNLSASDARSLALGLGVDLVQQDIEPSWAWRGELLQVNGKLHFDEEAGKTTLALAPLRALRRDVAIEASTDVFDGDSLRLVTSGKVHIDLAGLPFAVQGVTLDALKFDLASEALSWDGTRVAGAIEYGGRLRGAELTDPSGSTRVSDVTLTGHGAFEPDGGRFQATLKVASVSSRSAQATADIGDVTLELGGTTRELAGAQQFDARALLAIAAAHLATPAGPRIALTAARFTTQANASALDLAAQTLPRLESALEVARLELGDATSNAVVEKLSASVAVDRLAIDRVAELGVQGDATIALAIPVLHLFDGPARARQRSARLSLAGLDVRATLPLALPWVKGTLVLASVRSEGDALDQLALDLDVQTPLGWAPDRDGNAQATVSGRLARLDAGGTSHGAVPALRLFAEKRGRDRYRLELDATGSRLAAFGLPLPGDITAELRADAAPAAGELKVSAGLHGAGGADVALAVDAHFEPKAERLVYSAELSAQKLEAFAGVASRVDGRATRVRFDGARLQASARGELGGVLRAVPGSLPTPVEHPLRTAKGNQSARLELDGLDYRDAEQVFRVPKLELELESAHRAEAGGNASARVQMKSLALDGGGTSLRIDGLDQKLTATFDRAPDQGMVDVHTSLTLASAAQSWVPGYPVRGLTFSTNMQVDRLSSIYLRELRLDNPASGSALRASGTLELLAQGNPAPAGDRTIVGRQALSFEGRLEQELSPLARLEIASHASGSLALPFRLESGGLLGYRLLAKLEAKQVSFALEDGSLAIEGLNGGIPVVEEFALLESGPVLGQSPRTSPLSDTRFFDVHPFLSASDYVTARSISLGGLAPIGPVAANVRVERSDFIIDQLQTGYRGGQIVGQVRVAWRDGDPIVRLRLNATGVRSGKSNDVFDANMALTFVPAAMTLDGKMQIVRASREHLEDILDVLDPFHESANANRVRQGLALGYPKFVRFALHDGAVDTKVELGGIARLVRIDEIKAVPLGPILQKYVASALSSYLRPAPGPPAPVPSEVPVESALRDPAAEERQPRVQR
jgi:translocation and assembly module TamB